MSATITREIAEIVDGPWYEWDAKATAVIEPHIPSDHDLEQQFRRRLGKLAPGTECTAGRAAAGRYCVVDGVNYQRSRRYLLVRLPHEDIAAAHTVTDVVRRAYFDAAELLADSIGLQVAEMRREHDRVAVGWLPSGLLHHLADRTDGRVRRLGVDMDRDGYVAIIAAYYVVAPVSKQGFGP